MKTRAALGQVAVDDLAYLASRDQKMGRQWFASLLDYAIAVGQAEAQRRAERIFGPFVAEMLDPPKQTLDMECHMVMAMVMANAQDDVVSGQKIV